ncbi:MAG: hypothetical protein LBG91_03005, partial [Treponema sp.]|nr:hypothetical protein [Treponema sp.]
MKRSKRPPCKTLAAAILAALLFISCEQPPGRIPAISDEKILSYPDDAIFINSPADMANIGVVETHPLTGTYVLTGDITLENWTPIGDAANPFYGVFDGNGKTITLTGFANAAVAGRAYLGIFGYAKGTPSRKAAIRDLSIISSVNVISDMAAGQAAGLTVGYAELAEMDNITLSGNFAFESKKTVYIGGVVGHINGNGTIVKNCNSSMTMDAKPGFGSPLVKGMANSFSFVGGFAGLFTDAAGIENCHNTGTVSGIGDHIAATQVIVGGVAGGSFYGYSTAFQGYIHDSSSTGNITTGARGNWPMAGGIAGIICGGNGTKESSTRIERCFAAGTVTVADVLETTSQNQWSYIGGIVGYVYYGGWVSQCYFDGRVIVNRINDCTGGIAGYSSYAIGDVAGILAGSPAGTFALRLCVIEDCWSDGEVIGYNNAGGIVGQNQQNTILRRCYSLMDVSVANNANGPNTYAQWGVGGIAGSHSSTNPVDAMFACVALNRSISAPLGDESHRITGRMQEAGGVMPKMTNNYALPDLIPVT